MSVIGHYFVKRLVTSAMAAGMRNLGLDYAEFTVILHGVLGLKLIQFEAEVRQLVSCVQPDLGPRLYDKEKHKLDSKQISNSQC